MCGIAGFTHLRKPLPAGVLTNAVDSITHRGPNQKARFECEEVSLGATRLAILDIAGGDQPIFSADRDAVIVYNGEVFNFVELRQELEREGAVFHTHCDTEVILQAYLHWGDAAFARLRGMFAIAIWVQSQRRLVLARDRMGIKPLYYFQQDGEVYFGSELKCIFANPDVPRRICLAGLNCYLSLNYVPAPYTLVEGIVKLLPGHMLEWKNGECSTRSYLPPTRQSAGAGFDRRSLRGTRRPAAEIRRGRVGFRCAAWRVAERRTRFLVRPALRGRCQPQSAAYLFGHVSGPLVRREQVHSRSQSPFRHQSHRLRPEHRRRTGRRHPADRVLLRRAQRRCRSRALVVPRQDDGAGCHRDSDRRRRATNCLPAISPTRPTAISDIARKFPAPLRKAALAAANFLPVSDDKISFEYKVKRFLQGSLMEPGTAHLFWNGTFSDDEKEQLFRYADSAPAGRSAQRPASGPRPGALPRIRPALLPGRRHSLQGRPHQHGALAGSAASISR